MSDKAWRITYVVSFLVGFAIGVVLAWPSAAQEGKYLAVPGQYMMPCPVDTPAYLADKGYKEVDSWINADGTHRWVMHENSTEWLLTMHNALTQTHCVFDFGKLEDRR